MHGNAKYTEEMINYLKQITPGKYNDEITKIFNMKFNTNFTKPAIKQIRCKYRIKSNVGTARAFYTEEMIEYLKEITHGRTCKEITKMFNKKFNLDKSNSTIKNLRVKNKIYTHRVGGQFEKGHKTWNKGLKGYMGPNNTSFKKGRMPHNHQPVGTERINGEGYTDIKIADPNVWKQKHRIIWEEHYGEIPAGHVILFGDGDKTNLDIDNLICISRTQLATLNKKDMIQNDANLTRTAINILELESKIRWGDKHV